MSDRATCWSLTINNPTEDDDECIARARQKGWKVDGQPEKGEKDRTRHYQLILKTPQVRFSAVKKAFPRAHIQIARNPAALEQYCHKEETRDGELPSSSDKYPSLSKFWMLVYKNCHSQNWIDLSGDAWWREAFDDFSFPREKYNRYAGWEGRMNAHERHLMNVAIAVEVFESCVGHLIEEGYHIEHFYSPPNISVFKKFHFSIFRRCQLELQAQTDRQTDSALESQETVVPIIENNDQEGISQEENESPPSSPGPSSPDQSTPPSHP